MTISLMTYNIKTDVSKGSVEQEKDFNSRCQPLLDKLSRLELGDIINLQAVPHEGVERLKQLKDYHVVEGQHKNRNESLVILLRKERFEAPEAPLVLDAPDAANTNVSLIVRAIEKETERVLTIFNTHVSEDKDLARNQVNELTTKLHSFDPQNNPILGSGTFFINHFIPSFLNTHSLNLGLVLKDQAPPDTVTFKATVVDKRGKPRNIEHQVDHFIAGWIKTVLITSAGNQGAADNFVQSDHYPLFGKVELSNQLLLTPPGPFQHRQPKDSFNAKVFQHFQAHHLPDLAAKKHPYLRGLDRILTAYPDAKNCETAVKDAFRKFLKDRCLVHDLGVNFLLMPDLENAFEKARKEVEGNKPAPKPPEQAKAPEPKKPVEPPKELPKEAAKPAAPQAPAAAKTRKWTVGRILAAPFNLIGGLFRALFRKIRNLFKT